MLNTDVTALTKMDNSYTLSCPFPHHEPLMLHVPSWHVNTWDIMVDGGFMHTMAAIGLSWQIIHFYIFFYHTITLTVLRSESNCTKFVYLFTLGTDDDVLLMNNTFYGKKAAEYNKQKFIKLLIFPSSRGSTSHSWALTLQT